MKIEAYIDRILSSEAVQDLIHELVAMELANASETLTPENALGDKDRHEIIVDKEAARVMHNFFTTPARHIP